MNEKSNRALGMTTEEAAAALRLKPSTLHAALARSGSYFGLTPARLPNRRLAWPAAAVMALAVGEPMA